MSAVWEGGGEKKGRDVFLQCLPFLLNRVTAIKEYHFPQKITLSMEIYCV